MILNRVFRCFIFIEMSEIENNLDSPEQNQENTKFVENEEVKNEIEQNDGIVRRSDKTVKQTIKDAKQRAIDNFKRGVIDPEYRVVKMGSGKYRTYKRKEILPPEPIKLNQVPENKPSNLVQANDEIEEKPRKPKNKGEHDPFSDIVYYNMSNQISEQLNKRLDAVNVELERLRHKNSKLKGKYKQLKQAIYITEEEEDEGRPPMREHNENKEINEEKQENINQQQEPVIIRPTRRTNAINFNRFFN